MPRRTVLVTDPDRLVRELIVEVLRGRGWEAIPATDAAEAGFVLRALARHMRALITEVELDPKRRSGWDLATLGRELVPDLLVIYTPRWPISSDPRAVERATYLTKPFSIRDLLSLLGNAGQPQDAGARLP